MKYRAEIDGLRALAVLPVVFFHAGFSLFSGGFVGVDVFFVISGYLITTILIEDIEKKRFSLIHFYERPKKLLTQKPYTTHKKHLNNTNKRESKYHGLDTE